MKLRDKGRFPQVTAKLQKSSCKISPACAFDPGRWLMWNELIGTSELSSYLAVEVIIQVIFPVDKLLVHCFVPNLKHQGSLQTLKRTNDVRKRVIPIKMNRIDEIITLLPSNALRRDPYIPIHVSQHPIKHPSPPKSRALPLLLPLLLGSLCVCIFPWYP